jgi:hypothetical protein
MDTRFKNKLPSDAYLIKEIGPWAFSFSKSNCSIYVSTSEYHAGPLKLTRENLTELTDIMEKHRDEVEKNIVSELERHLASIIEKEGCQEAFKGSKIKLIMPSQSKSVEINSISKNEKLLA